MFRPLEIIKQRLRKSYLIAIFSIAGALVLSACGGNTGQTLPPTDIQEYSTEDYRIGVGDVIKVDVWGNDRLSVQVPVRPDGKISMSLIGDVLAAGMTTVSLSETVTDALLTYIKNPQVTVIVTNPSSSDFQNRVRVTGAVRSPQSTSYRKGMTVLDLVLMAGGPNEFAQPNKAKLYRRVSGTVKNYPIYLDDILNLGQLDTNYTLVPSDIITVPERSF